MKIGVTRQWHRHSNPSLARTTERNRSERLLLITGTPGTGKRVVGNYLVDSRDFVHIDFDNRYAQTRFLGSGKDGLQAALEANIEPGQDLVITWSSASSEQLPFVRTMQSIGFEWIWFDSDRGAVYQDAIARRARNGSAPHFVDAFNADGTFRPIEALACELLEPRPVVEPRRVRAGNAATRRRTYHVPAWWRLQPARAALGAVVPGLRPGIAWALALTAAVGGAIGGYVAAGDSGARQPAHSSCQPFGPRAAGCASA